MKLLAKEISAEEFARYQAMTRGDLNRAVESTLSEDIVCGYGYYGAYISAEGGKHFLNIRIGDSCD